MLLIESGFFIVSFVFFFSFLILSPVTPASRFSWMFTALISLIFFFFLIFNTLDLNFLENGIYFSTLNQSVKCLIFLTLIGFSFIGLGSLTFTFEYIVLILFSASAGLFILSTDNISLIFLLIEVQALIGYTLVVYRRKSQSATEAGMKYFLLGSVSSSLMLFGMVLLYGSVGSFSLTTIGFEFNFLYFDLKTLGSLFVLFGFFFKLSAAPLHFWTPEVYENIEFLTVSYFSSLPKISILAILTNQGLFFLDLFSEIFLAVGILSLVFGAVNGVFQDSLKKIFAYSTIANTGYILILLSVSKSDLSLTTVWLQMGLYILTLTAVSGFLQLLSNGSEFNSLLSLTYSSIYLRLIFLILFISLSGIPPTSGFFVKFLILYLLNNVFLGITVMAASILTLFYYMRIAGTIFFYTREHEFFTSTESNFLNNHFFKFFAIPVAFLNIGFLFLVWF